MSKYRITLNGKTYEMDVEAMDGSIPASPKAAPKAVAAAPKAAPAPVASAPAAPVASSSAAGAVNSPMPGTILRVNKNVGDTVAAGEAVVVLEAMKMENDIPAGKAGVIKSIAVAQGQAVAAGEFLFEVE
ncbi:MAG: acetyl-CoA carboxylase biotin carboxyl carrier protein subunit [Saccharofermentans sp.]|nr:acetyl-CoA carboxylase biotin carboxyl carrier protein subunit [Saccharofermentans sp.]